MRENFFRKVLEYEGRSNPTPEKSVMVRNLSLIRIAAVIVCCVSLYWIVIDFFVDSYSLNTYSFICVILHLISSVYMFFLPGISSKPDSPLVRISFVVYYLLIIIGVATITLSRNINIVASGDISPNIGVSVSAFYLFLLTLLPLPQKEDSLIVLAFMFIGLVFPEVIVHTSSYSLFSHILLCVCFALVYHFMRKMLLETAEKEVEIDKLSNKLFEYSYCDPLTSILNRRAFDMYIKYLEKNSDSKQIGVAFFDLDYFKSYNDYYGHISGDTALKSVASSVVKTLSGLDDAFAFRYGGDEFIILFDNISEDLFVEMMCRIRQDVYDMNLFREDLPGFDRVTITEGGAIEPVPSSSGDYVLAADNQLYVGKTSSRNSVYFKGSKIDSQGGLNTWKNSAI